MNNKKDKGVCCKNIFYTGQSVNQSQLVQQAQAAAYLALKSLGYVRGQREEDEILAQAGIPSRIIKVGNFLNVAMAINLNKNEWNEMREDLIEGFQQCGQIEDDFFVNPYQAGLGAEAGSLFLVYINIEDAQRTVVSMYGRTYNQRALKIIFINEQTYIRSYIPLKLKQQPETEEVQINQENDNYDNEHFEDQEDYLEQKDNRNLENNNNNNNNKDNFYIQYFVWEQTNKIYCQLSFRLLIIFGSISLSISQFS